MFPERPKPSIASLLDNEYEDSKKRSGDGSGGNKTTIDYLAAYGGTIGLLSVGLIGALIYSYYESAQDRNRIEEKINSNVKIEPYEIQELRYRNRLTYDQYCDLCNQVLQVHRKGKDRHSHSHSSQSMSMMSYRDFISILVEFAKTHQLSFQSMHLLDRIVITYLTTMEENNNSNNSNNIIASTDTVTNTGDKPSSSREISPTYDKSRKDPIKYSYVDQQSVIPLAVLLVMLHLLMLTDDIGERIQGLCYAASLLDDDDRDDGDDCDDCDDCTDSERPQSKDMQSVKRLPNENYKKSSTALEQQQSLSRRSLELIIEALLVTDQVPPSKQVVETGVRWPIKLHRMKRPCDMLDEVITILLCILSLYE